MIAVEMEWCAPEVARRLRVGVKSAASRHSTLLQLQTSRFGWKWIESEEIERARALAVAQI